MEATGKVKSGKMKKIFETQRLKASDNFPPDV